VNELSFVAFLYLLCYLYMTWNLKRQQCCNYSYLFLYFTNVVSKISVCETVLTKQILNQDFYWSFKSKESEIVREEVQATARI